MFCTSCGSNLGSWSNKSCPRCGAPLRTTGVSGPGVKSMPAAKPAPTVKPEPAAIAPAAKPVPTVKPEPAAKSAPASTPPATKPASQPSNPPFSFESVPSGQSLPLLPWLIGLGAFALFVAALWWGLGFNKSPVLPPRTQPPPQTTTNTPDIPIDIKENPKLPTSPWLPDILRPTQEPPRTETPPVTPDTRTPDTVTPPVTPDTRTPDTVTPPVTPDTRTPKTTNGDDDPQPSTGSTTPPPPKPRVLVPPAPPEWLPAMRAERSRCNNFFCEKSVQKKYCNGYWNKLPECMDTLRE